MPTEVVLDVEDQPCGIPNSIDYESPPLKTKMVLSGRVTDEDGGKGLGGVTVKLLSDDPATKAQVRLSKADGSFAFVAVPAARYSVRVWKDAYWPTEFGGFLVPRENQTILSLVLLRKGKMFVCQ